MTRLRLWFEKHAQDVVVVSLHAVAWFLYFGMFFLTASPQGGSPTNRFWYVISIVVTDMPLFYYFYHNAIPRLLAGKRGWLFTGLLLGVTALYPLVRYGSDLLITYYLPEFQAPLTNLVTTQFWPAYGVRGLSCLFVISMAGMGKFTFDWFKNARIRRELENQNLTSELAFLKSQINPHFLFNTLNNIHTLAYKKSDGAPEAIMKLSDLMRYMLYESDTEVVPLDTEIAHLKSFIGLQALRFKTRNIVQLDISGDTASKMIAPLLLLPFVENAFKHGYNLKKEGAIVINLNADDDIQFSVENEQVPRGMATQKDEAGGIGLENINRRLELIYKADYTLAVEESSSHFKINLTLKRNG
ncbi:MAG: histidine kinase [Roseivirga sp.]|nr:histidine kinase [Roseivirga sp.]